jgi:hypothetical protein
MDIAILLEALRPAYLTPGPLDSGQTENLADVKNR